MSKGQKKSNREAKKPKKNAAEKSSIGTGAPLLAGKGAGVSYKERYGKTTSK